MIERKDTEEIAAQARLAAIDGHVLWNTELVWLDTTQQKVD
jgi:hypothetical protein